MGVEKNGGFVKVAVSRAVRLLSVSVKRVSSVYADAANKSNRSLLYDNHATARKKGSEETRSFRQ